MLVVLIEGLDLCPLKDREKGSEFCEIEEQGGLIMDHRTWPVRSTERKADLWLWPYLIGLKGNTFESVDELRPREDSREGVDTSELRHPFKGVFRIVVTWLILPVVICLSQRLSHACLSINKFVL